MKERDGEMGENTPPQKINYSNGLEFRVYHHHIRSGPLRAVQSGLTQSGDHQVPHGLHISIANETGATKSTERWTDQATTNTDNRHILLLYVHAV